jgi:hypothetical protein
MKISVFEHSMKEFGQVSFMFAVWRRNCCTDSLGNRCSVHSQHSIGASMYGDCPECNRLSANLSEASKAYFVILEKSQLAQSENNLTLVSTLETLKLAAVEKRGKARQELRQHEASHPKASGQTA